MATASYDADLPSLGRLARGWDRFWFGRTDPTTLGLIRICTGLVVLYVQLAYTPDLQQLCGKHAWLDQQGMDQLRRSVQFLIAKRRQYYPAETGGER